MGDVDDSKMPPPAYGDNQSGQAAPSAYPPPPSAYPPQQQGYPPQQQGYPPQQQGYPPQQQPPYTTQPTGYNQPPTNQVVVTVPVVAQQRFGSSPVSIICQHCQASVTTTVNRKPGLLPWLICLGLGVAGLWLCCFIPLCIPDLYDTDHTCPSCHHLVGTHKHI